MPNRKTKPRIARARALRRDMSLPEAMLWKGLRSGRLAGLKFRRQHPAGAYVLDFYCPALRLAVEVDGRQHDFGDQPQHDRIRDERLAAWGVRTVRIPASWVLDSVDGVLSMILEEARRTSPSGPPGHLPPQGEA